jgi:hypothetical protein
MARHRKSQPSLARDRSLRTVAAVGGAMLLAFLVWISV